MPARNWFFVSLALEHLITPNHLRIARIADLIPRTHGIFPAVGTELVFGYDALKVKLADAFKELHARTLNMVCKSQTRLCG